MSMTNDNVAELPVHRLRRVDASRYLRERHGIDRAPQTLAKLAVTGGGPEYELFGRIPYYRPVKLDEWVLSRLQSTSHRVTAAPDAADAEERRNDRRHRLVRRRRPSLNNGESEVSVKIEDIQVGHRHRRDLGDIAGLAASIADLGLLHPIIVSPDGRLIAGQRRLEACKRLGWTEIPVNTIEVDDNE